MIEVNSQTRIADTLHNFAEVTVETFFAHVLIKRRQHQHTGATVLNRTCRERDRFNDRNNRCPASWHGSMPAATNASSNDDALVCRHRVRLASRAERGKPAVLRKQPLAVPDEAFPVRRKIRLTRCYDRCEHAPDALARGKRVDCSIIQHVLTLPSSFQLFEREWTDGVAITPRQLNEPVFRPGIRFSIAVFHW